jgi:predicted amidohydrolase
LYRYHLTGWEPEDPAFALCAADYNSYLESYRALAAELHMNIVPGTIVEAHPNSRCPPSCPSCPITPSSAPILLNIAYFISSSGVILGSYQKANLWHGERAHLLSIRPTCSPHRVIPTPLGPVGLLICWDVAFPEGFRKLVAQGAKIIIVPAFWTGLGSAPEGLKRNPGFEKLTMQSVLMARAFENTAAVVFVNAGGVQEGNLGLSQVVLPFVGSVAPPLGHAEGMAIVNLDMQVLEDAEQVYRVRQDMAGETWPYMTHGNFTKGS